MCKFVSNGLIPLKEVLRGFIRSINVFRHIEMPVISGKSLVFVIIVLLDVFLELGLKGFESERMLGEREVGEGM
jgi:hypothetical protein